MNDDTLQLTPDEERRFASLFDEPTRLDLTADWERTLRAAIDGLDTGPSDDDENVEVLDLTAFRARRQPRSSRWLAAAAAAVAVIVGVVAVGLRGVDTGPEQVEVLSPTRQIAAPQVRDLALPADTAFVTVAGDDIVALTELDGVTTINVRSGETWTSAAELPVTEAQFVVDGDRWIVAGADTGTRLERPGVDGTFLTTAIALATSDDEGATWRTERIVPQEIAVRDEIVLDAFPEGSRTVIRDFTLAAHDGTTAVLYDSTVHVDLTATARAAGLIGPDDEVVWVQDGGFGVSTFVVGPDRTGSIGIEPEVVGTTRAGLNELEAEVNGSRHRLVVADENGLETVDLPGVLGNEPFEQGEWRASSLTSDDDGFVVSDLLGRAAHRSTDGRSWTETDLDGAATSLPGGWAIEQGPDGEIRQSIDGRPFTRIPVPTETTTVAAFAPTEFGAAVVWQDIPSIVRGLLDARVERDGWTIEQSVAGGLEFTSPGGETFVRPNGVGEFDGGWVVTDLAGTVQILDAAGERLVMAEQDDLRVEVDGLRPSEQFVGWSTDGDDWRYAEIASLEPGIWNYLSTPDGLLGIEMTRTDRAVLIEWPAAFTE